MNKILAAIVLLSALALPFLPPAQAACPAGSPAGINCENYQGQVLDSVTGGTAQRKDQDRFNDQGVNILEFGADPTGNTDSTAAIQAAIDYSFTSGGQNTYCPAGKYQTSYPIFVDPPGNMRGGGAWNQSVVYAQGDIVTYNSTLYSLQVSQLRSRAFPTAPYTFGYGGQQQDLAYEIVSSTAGVTYNPSWNTSAQASAALATFKGSSIGTPVNIGNGGGAGPGSGTTTPGNTVDAPMGSNIIVSVNDVFNSGVTSLTDSAGNSYTKAVTTTVGGDGSGTQTIWYSLNTTHDLPIGGTFTATLANPSGFYVLVAATVTGITSLDQTAFTGSNSVTSISVPSGTLGQANEIVFGTVTINNFPNAYPTTFVQPSGFTTVSPSQWNVNVNWSSATTYGNGDVVLYEGIPWTSLQSGNTNNVPQNDLGSQFAPVWWKPTSNSAPTLQFAYGASFHGIQQNTPANNGLGVGCLIKPTFNNAVALMQGPGNGNMLSDFNIIAPGGTHCNQPPNGIGISISGTPGGANRTILTRVGVQNEYWGIGWGGADSGMTPVSANSQLGAENHLYNPNVYNACFGITDFGTQGFINTISEADIEADTAVQSYTTVGINIFGGNFSAFTGHPASKFTIGSISAVYSTPNTSLTVTGTLTLSGDPFMVNSCTYSGTTGGSPPQNTNQWNTLCLGNVYNAWTIVTPDFGVLPLILVGFNSGTGAATWVVYPPWLSDADNTNPQLITEIEAATTIYAADMVRVFSGNAMNVDQVHIENDGVPTEFVDTTSGFGGVRASIINNTYFNYDYSLGNQSNPSNAGPYAQFLAQNSFSFINLQNPLYLNNICCGVFSSDYNTIDFLWDGNVYNGGLLQVKGGTFGNFNYRAKFGSDGAPPFTAAYKNLYNGLGVGHWDVTPWTPLWFTFGSTNPQQDLDVLDRTMGGNSGPYVGVRPAPWSSPCLSPSQLATMQSLPAITNSGGRYAVPYPALWSGQQYKVCDYTLTPTTYDSGKTYAAGDLVTSSAVTYYSLVNSNVANTPASSPTDWAPFHYGIVSNHGVGFSYGQDLTTSNVPGLSVTSGYGSSRVYISDPSLMFPGLGGTLSLTGSGCTGPQSFLVIGVHFKLGYVDVLNTTPGSAQLSLPTGCTGVGTATTIGQNAYSFTNLN